MKLRYQLIEKLHILTRSEFRLLLYAIRIQDDATGRVEGLYYRDVMKHTGMCKQSVYNALRGLQKKGIILVTGRTDVDCNIRILDNACPDAQARAEGYINLNRKAFRSAAFGKLKAHEIYLLLVFYTRTHEPGHKWKVGVELLRKEFGSLLGVTKRVIRSYLHSLKQFFSIEIKEGNYYISSLSSEFRKPSRAEKTEAQTYREHLIRTECHRSRIQYEAGELEDTASLLKQYPQSGNDVKPALMQSIRYSVEGLPRRERTLNVPYIHKLLRQALGLPQDGNNQKRQGAGEAVPAPR